MSAGSVFIPGYGLLDLNNKAKQQLSSIFRVKWFDAFKHMPVKNMVDYLRAYLDHLPEDERTVMKVVARRHMEGEKKENETSEGILRGVVSPNYSPIPDVRIVDTLTSSCKGQLDEMGFIQNKVTDNGSHFMLVYKDKVSLCGTEAGGMADYGYFGLRMRNSDVGTYALSFVIWLIRWACSNGMIVGKERETLLYKRHRFIETDELNKLVVTAFKELPAHKEKVVSMTNKLHSIKLKDPVSELNTFLRGQPKYVKEAAEKAYKIEPNPTAFGALQALTRISTAARDNMDRQYDLELLARSYANYALAA
jgi:hypothetical protein